MSLTVKYPKDVSLPQVKDPNSPEWDFLAAKRYLRGLVNSIQDYLHEHGEFLTNISGEIKRDDNIEVFYPEYPGATFRVDGGGANTGTLLTDSEGQSNYQFNYYQWSSTESTLQVYDIIFQWRLPKSFKEFTSTDALVIDICTQELASSNNKVDIIISKDGSTATTSSLLSKTSSATIWSAFRLSTHLVSFTSADPILSSLKSGDTLDVCIRMHSKASKYVKIGAITIQYMS